MRRSSPADIYGAPRVFLDLRYLAGLTNISDDPNIDAAVRNRGFAILMGARF